jgi:hypothetical protein
MTPPTTPGRPGRIRAALLTALLATVAGTVATPAVQAAEPPPPHTYKVTADVDGRRTPSKNDIAITNFVRRGERVPIECQAYGGLAYGSRWWDLVSKDGATLFVPDRYVKTGTSGEAPDIRLCTEDELNE